ncbi:MAG TPA: polysaccharide biosynthesis/export family protein [Gemmatimonadaceae bacterium]
MIAILGVSAAITSGLPAQQPVHRDTTHAAPVQGDSARLDSARRAQILSDTAHTPLTRSQLESEAGTLDKQGQQAQAALIRQRLKDGDFQVGDRIAIVVRGDSTLSDTATVRAGRVIQLRNLPAIPLAGVLHSELQDYLTKQLSQYLKNPTVQVTPLVQIAVVGNVGHPGFFWVPADLTLTDAIMLAGGPTPTSDLNGTKIKRDNKDRLTDKQVRQAFASGATLDQLDMRAGDQISVPEAGKKDWVRILQVTAALAAVTVALISISRH